MSVLSLNTCRYVVKLEENKNDIYIMRKVAVGFNFLELTFLINSSPLTLH